MKRPEAEETVPAAEENDAAPEQTEEKPEIVIETAPADFRSPQQIKQDIASHAMLNTIGA